MIFRYVLVFLFLIPFILGDISDLRLDSTFHSISVIADFTGQLDEKSITLEYKGDGSWKLAHTPAIIDSHIAGSIFYLDEDNIYDVRLTAQDQILEKSIRTRSSLFPSGSGKDIYVSISGTGDGSFSSPYGSIQDAIDSALPGDIIHLMPGTYHEEVSFSSGGTSDAYITLKGDGDVFWYGYDPDLISTFWIKENDYYKKQIGYKTSHVSFDDKRLFNYNQHGYTFSQFQDQAFFSLGIKGGFWSDGEWLYIYPPSGEDPADSHIQVADTRRGMTITGDYIVVKDIEFGYFGTDPYGRAISIEGGDNIVVANCTFRNTRTMIHVKDDSDYVLIEHNRFYDTSIKDWPWDKNKRHDTEGSGVSISGNTGNVVRYNYIDGPFNGIAASTWGDLFNEKKNYNCDIYSNFIEDTTDDGLEPEGANMNFRIWNNTLKNVYHPISLAPITKGPLYVIRNRIYNFKKSPIKYSNDFTGRVYVYHNTGYTLDQTKNGITPSGRFGNVISRNNIFLGHRYVYEQTRGETMPSDWDYDCLYTTKLAPDYSNWIKWNNQRYKTIEDFRSGTGQEINGISLDPMFAGMGSYNMDLLPASPCIDAGVFIPNINDWNYKGTAPDMGAIEFDSQSTSVCIDSDKDGFGVNPNNLCPDQRIDCDDMLSSINPDAEELCDDGIDNDCDMFLDCADPDCTGHALCGCGPADTTQPFGEISGNELKKFLFSGSLSSVIDTIIRWKFGCNHG